MRKAISRRLKVYGNNIPRDDGLWTRTSDLWNFGGATYGWPFSIVVSVSSVACRIVEGVS